MCKVPKIQNEKSSDDMYKKLNELDLQLSCISNLTNLIKEYLRALNAEDDPITTQQQLTGTMYILSNLMENTIDKLDFISSFIDCNNLFEKIPNEKITLFFNNNNC